MAIACLHDCIAHSAITPNIQLNAALTANRKSKPRGKLLLRHTQALTQRQNIHCLRLIYCYCNFLAFGMHNGFVQTVRDTVKSRSHLSPLDPCCNQNIHQFRQFVALSFAQIVLLVLGEQR